MDKIEKKEKKPFFFSFFDVSFIDIDFKIFYSLIFLAKMAKLTKIEIFISFNVLFHKKAKKYRALFLSHARLLKIFFQFLDLPTSSFVDFPDRKS